MGQQVFGKFADNGLGVAVRLQTLECLGAALLPVGKQGVHAVDEADKFGMLVDGRLNGLLRNRQIQVTGTIGFEQGFLKLRTNSPI